MTKETTLKAPAGRVRRTPLAVRNRLSIKERDPAYVYRIVNVKDDRIDQFKEAGYEIAPAQAVGDKRVDAPSTLGSAQEISVGQGMSAVLMRQRKEYYEEDQTTKQQQIDALEQTMKSDATRGK
jgi:hypothetical protein